MQTLLDPGLRPASNPHPALDPIQVETPSEAPSPRHKRNEGGFTMNELLVVLIIIGTLGLIGTGVYFLFIRDARDTVLNQNIQTAAEEMQSVLALQPSLAQSANHPTLVTEMTGRTNFVWSSSWLARDDDDANTVRFQFIDKGSTVVLPTTAAAPTVDWLVNGESAVRLHLRNSEGEWRCALLVLKPSANVIDAMTDVYEETAASGAAAALGSSPTEAQAAAYAAEMRGVWYDGGSSMTNTTAGNQGGIHDCSPIGGRTGTPAIHDDYMPESAQSWVFPVILHGTAPTVADQLDPSSTAQAGERTLHRAPGALDDNA